METLSHPDDETDRAAPRRAGDSVAQLHLVAGWNVFGTGSALEQSCGEDARVELFAEPNPAVEPPAGQSCHSDARLVPTYRAWDSATPGLILQRRVLVWFC